MPLEIQRTESSLSLSSLGGEELSPKLRRRPSRLTGTPAPSLSASNSWQDLPTPTNSHGSSSFMKGLPRAHRLPSMRRFNGSASPAPSGCPFSPTGSEPSTTVASPLHSAPPTAPVTPRNHSLEVPTTTAAASPISPFPLLGKDVIQITEVEEEDDDEVVPTHPGDVDGFAEVIKPTLPQTTTKVEEEQQKELTITATPSSTEEEKAAPSASSSVEHRPIVVAVNSVAKLALFCSLLTICCWTSPPMAVRFTAVTLLIASMGILTQFGFSSGLPHDHDLLEKHASGLSHHHHHHHDHDLHAKVSTPSCSSTTTKWANLDKSIPRRVVPFQHTRQEGALTWSGAAFSGYCSEIFWRNRVGPLGSLTFFSLGLFVYFAEEITGMQSSIMLCSICTGGFLSFLWQNTLHWFAHVEPQESHETVRRAAQDGEIEPFLAREISIKKHQHRDDTNVWLPHTVSTSRVVQRGMGFLGMPLMRYLWDLLTYATEYKIHKFFLGIMTDLGIFKGAPLTGESIYKAVVNGSYACWIDLDKSQFVLYDSLLPYNNTDCKWFYKIELDLDFEKKTVGEMRLEPYVAASAADDQLDEIEVISTRNLSEICAILGTLGLYKNHPAVHHWANSIGELSADEWVSAEDSHYCTQGLNNAAVFSTPVGNGVETSSTWAGLILAQNVAAEGVPVHSRIGSVVTEDSLVHQMTQKCRAALRCVLPHVHRCKREAIIMATVMHAADHHYVCKYLPLGGGSEILNHSSHFFWGAIAFPGRYYSRSLLCKERAHYDPVCKALYDSCASVDKEFADNYLTIGILF